jgi:flagellar biosynthetic protein FliR
MDYSLFGSSAFLQVLARCLGVFSVAPVFGSKVVPLPVRAAFAVVFSMAIFAGAARYVGAASNAVQTLESIVAQAAIGATIGLVTRYTLLGADMAASWIEAQAGLSFASLSGLDDSEERGPLASLLANFAVVLFLLMNGHYLVITTLASSFAQLPVALFSFTSQSLLASFASFAMAVMVAGFRLALPAIAVMLLVEAAAAVASRMSATFNPLSFGLSLRAVAAIIVVAAVLPLMSYEIGQLVASQTGVCGPVLMALKK